MNSYFTASFLPQYPAPDTPYTGYNGGNYGLYPTRFPDYLTYPGSAAHNGGASVASSGNLAVSGAAAYGHDTTTSNYYHHQQQQTQPSSKSGTGLHQQYLSQDVGSSPTYPDIGNIKPAHHHHHHHNHNNNSAGAIPGAGPSGYSLTNSVHDSVSDDGVSSPTHHHSHGHHHHNHSSGTATPQGPGTVAASGGGGGGVRGYPSQVHTPPYPGSIPDWSQPQQQQQQQPQQHHQQSVNPVSSPSPSRLQQGSPYGSPGVGEAGGKPLSSCSMSPKELPGDENPGQGSPDQQPTPFYPWMGIVGKSFDFCG